MDLIYDNVRPTVGYFKGQDGHCRVRVYSDETTEDPKGRYVILISELPENAGISVTNSVERIAGRIIHDLELFYDSVTVIQHLPADRGKPECVRDEEFSVVTFTRPPTGDRNDPARCSWKFIERSAVERLVRQPISPLADG